MLSSASEKRVAHVFMQTSCMYDRNVCVEFDGHEHGAETAPCRNHARRKRCAIAANTNTVHRGAAIRPKRAAVTYKLLVHRCAPMNNKVSVCTRTVAEYTDSKNKVGHWVPPLARLSTHDGATFVKLGYTGDRGFAKFCGAPMGMTNPLRAYNWLGTAVKLRDAAVDEIIDKLTMEQDVTHRPGSKVKNKEAYASKLPATVDVALPAVAFDGTTVGPLTVRVVAEIGARVSISIEATEDALGYVRVAMAASKGAATPRARPAHTERFSAKTGVKGVYLIKKRGSLQVRRCNEDGKITHKHQKVKEGAPDVAAVANALKHGAVKEEDADEDNHKGASLAEQAAGEDADSAGSSDVPLVSLKRNACDDVHTSAQAVEATEPVTNESPAKVQSMSPAWQQVFGAKKPRN